MQERTCCFIGHRQIEESEQLKTSLRTRIEALILQENVDTFLFGSKSQFDAVCYAQVTKLKEKYPHIKRIYVRAEFPVINESYQAYLLESYEATFYPDMLLGAGRSRYVERNSYMIDQSRFCVLYYDQRLLPRDRRSGTKLALAYAKKKGKRITLLP